MPGDKRKNPWGAQSNDDRPKGGWNSGSPRGGQEPPDIDEVLRKAQEGFKNLIPGGNAAGLFTIGLFVLLGLWLASGFHAYDRVARANRFFAVNPGEHAVIQRFGAYSRTQIDPGLGFHLPWPFETATIVNVEQIQKLTIGFNEALNRAGTSSRQDVPDESLMLTADRNIVDLDLIIQWNIKSAEQFLFQIENQEHTIKKVAESAIREVVGQSAMFPIITTARDAVANRTKEILQKNLDDYDSGVNITQVLIEKAEIHPEVQNAFQDVQSAKQNAEEKENNAIRYRNDIIPKARGEAFQMKQGAEAYKQSIIARAKGDADRFNATYEAYLTGKDVTKERIYIETMESVLKNAQTIIMDGNAAGDAVPYIPLNELPGRSQLKQEQPLAQ